MNQPSLYRTGGLGAADRKHTIVDEHLRTIAGFSRRSQEVVTNSRQGFVDSSKIHRLTAKVRHLREQLDASDAQSHHMRFQLVYMQDELDNTKSEFSAIAATYYRKTNERNHLLFDTI